ncbi:MAG: S8 family serine peptidase [candidate division Zixibacteria bacterium]|nr:S8 family serine peptidase [candidate division Zixibacteria bacterium]
MPDPAAATRQVQQWCEPLGVHAVKRLLPNLPSTAAAAAPPNPGERNFILGVDSLAADGLVRRLSDLPWVEYAEVDHKVELHQLPDDPLVARQWDLENTGQPYWSILGVPGDSNDVLIERTGTPGADIRFGPVYRHAGRRDTILVGVVDTGIDTGHVDLRDHVWRNPGEIPDNGLDDDHDGFVDDVNGWDFSGDIAATPLDLVPDNDVSDFLGHGTHVSGTIAATSDNGIGMAGIADQARIVGIKMFPNSYLSVSAQAIYYAVARGVRVINMSWGGDFPSRALEDALEYAHARGVVLVASMGNSGRDQLFYPAAYPQTIGVGSSTARDLLSRFSTYNDFVDVIAPGQDILSLRAAGTDLYADVGEPNVHVIDQYYLNASGTSMSAPHVTGAAAVLLSLAPGLSNERVRQILRATAIDIVDPYGDGQNLPGFDRYTGAGRIDLAAAVASLPDLFVRVTWPLPGLWIGGEVVIRGSAIGGSFTHYNVLVAPGYIEHATEWTTITSSANPVETAILALWPTAGLEGPFTIRLDAGPDALIDVPVNLVQAPTAQINSPKPSDTVVLLKTIVGRAAAPGFVSYRIEAMGPMPTDTVHVVTESSRPVWDDTLAIWRADSLPEGDYRLVLTVQTDGVARRDSVTVAVRSAFLRGWPVELPAAAHFAVTAVNLDGRGMDEIVCPTGKGLYVLNGDGTIYPGWPRDTTSDVSTAPAVADLDNDGKVEIIVASPTKLHVYAFIGEEFAGWPRPFAGGLPSVYGNSLPTVGNLDGRGALEVAAIDRLGRILAWKADGSDYLPENGGQFGSITLTNSLFNSLPRLTICDLDRDGRPELIAAGDDILLFDGRTALPFRGNPSTQLRSHYSIHGMVVGDFDHDGVRDIAYVASEGPSSPFVIDIIDVHGRSLPGWPRMIPLTVSKYLLSSMAAGDVDGDGTPELFVAPYSLGNGFIYAYHANGSSLGADSSDGLFASLSGSLSGVALVDLDGDAQPEIVVRMGDLIFGPDEIVALRPDGSLVPGYPLFFGNGSSGIMSAPIIGDVNHDGITDMVTVQSNSTNVAIWSLGSKAGLRGRPWPKFRADLWNSGVLATPQYDVTYLVRLIDMFFRGGPGFPPYEPADVNCDGTLDLTDVVGLMGYLYRQGPAPCAP